MKQLMAAIIVLNMVGFTPAEYSKGTTYSFDIPDDMKFEVKLYAFDWGPTSNQSSFYMSNLGCGPEFDSATIEMMGTAIEAKLTADESKLVSKHQNPVDFGIFKGTEIVIVMEKAGEQESSHIFLLHDGKNTWQGHLFNSNTNEVKRVYSLLKSAHRKTANLEK